MNHYNNVLATGIITNKLSSAKHCHNVMQIQHLQKRFHWLSLKFSGENPFWIIGIMFGFITYNKECFLNFLWCQKCIWDSDFGFQLRPNDDFGLVVSLIKVIHSFKKKCTFVYILSKWNSYIHKKHFNTWLRGNS
jgi:hypothetical protein